VSKLLNRRVHIGTKFQYSCAILSQNFADRTVRKSWVAA
jgi:hypothetical protein